MCSILLILFHLWFEKGVRGTKENLREDLLSMCTKPIKNLMLFESNQIHNSPWSHCGSNSWRRWYSSCTMWILVGGYIKLRKFWDFQSSNTSKNQVPHLSCNFRIFVTFQNVTKCTSMRPFHIIIFKAFQHHVNLFDLLMIYASRLCLEWMEHVVTLSKLPSS